MPVTLQAAKKLRHDRVRTTQHAETRAKLRLLVKATRASPSKKTLSAAFTALDKAAKTRVIHPNKAARLKARLSKLLAKK